MSECRRSRGSSDSDQGEVWSHIADKMETMSVRSASHAMEDIYTSHAPRLEAYAKAIRPLDGQAAQRVSSGTSLGVSSTAGVHNHVEILASPV